MHSFSARDAERLPAYYKMLDAAVALLRSQLLETPPADPRRLRDLWGALQMGRNFRKLDASVQRDIHELFTRSAGDLLDHWFGATRSEWQDRGLGHATGGMGAITQAHRGNAYSLDP